MNASRKCLEALLAATEAIEASLSPVDADAFSRAVALRADELERLRDALESETAGATPDVHVLELARRIEETEARNRVLSQEALQSLRNELKNMQTGGQALSGYRAPPDREPRFADRRG